MNPFEFKKIVELAVRDLISVDHFADVASRNWINSLGGEEELYPYLAEMIRRRLTCEVLGIGCGRYPNRDEKADCLRHLNIANRKITFSIELKGPSKDRSTVSSGLEEDLEKLNRLKREGAIEYGLAIGIWLIDAGAISERFLRVLTINSSRVGIKISIQETRANSAYAKSRTAD